MRHSLAKEKCDCDGFLSILGVFASFRASCLSAMTRSPNETWSGRRKHLAKSRGRRSSESKDSIISWRSTSSRKNWVLYCLIFQSTSTRDVLEAVYSLAFSSFFTILVIRVKQDTVRRDWTAVNGYSLPVTTSINSSSPNISLLIVITWSSQSNKTTRHLRKYI